MSSLELETVNKTELETAVVELLTEGGKVPRVKDIRFARSEYSSWYASYIVRVGLTNDEEIRLFLKDFGSYERPKEGMETRRARELFVYESLLEGAGLGTARYYGSVWKPLEQKYWLFLEFVHGMPVRHLDFQHWVRAAAWLGRFHSSFAPRLEELEKCPLLERYDADYFRSRANLARRSVSQISSELSTRLADVLEVYDGLIDSMVSGPKTLLHGAYLPFQILADADAREPRICPVDWELAGVGSPLYDFAFLSDGFEGDQLAGLMDSYMSTSSEVRPARLSQADLRFQVKSFRLFRTINWLGETRRLGLEDVEKLVHAAQDLSHGLSD